MKNDPPERALRTLHREGRRREKLWSQAVQVQQGLFKHGGRNVRGMIDQRDPPHPFIGLQR